MRKETDSKAAVEMNNISKSFGGINALDNVDISFQHSFELKPKFAK